MNRPMNQQQIKDTVILVIIAVSIFTIYQNSGRKNSMQAVEIASANQEAQIASIDYFKDIKLGAKSAIVFDASKNEVVFSKNSTEQLPLASITKIMTGIIAKEIYNPENKYLPEEKLKELLTAMLIESSNDAASIIAKSSEVSGATNFIGLMNKKAGELGLEQTIFSNPTGLDISGTVAGAYGSAKDVSELIVYGYQKYPDVFGQTKYSEIEMGGKMFINKNVLAGRVSGIVAGKTGLTNLAGGNLALIVNENNKLFAIVVLGSSEIGRFGDAEKLINAVAQYAQQ